MNLCDILKWFGLCPVVLAVSGFSFPQEQSQPQPKGESQSVAIERLKQVLSLGSDHDNKRLNNAKTEHKLRPD